MVARMALKLRLLPSIMMVTLNHYFPLLIMFAHQMAERMKLDLGVLGPRLLMSTPIRLDC